MNSHLQNHPGTDPGLNRRQFLRVAGTVAGTVAFCGVAHAEMEDGIVLNLDPSPQNPRNSEGAFLTLKSGRILFFYTRFYGGADDASPARIVSIYSDDAGRTWSREPRVVIENEGGANVMSVSLLRLRSGAIALFYLIKNSRIDCVPFMRISIDEAATWSAPRRVTEAPGYFVLNNDRVIQLQSGRLIAPLSFHRARGTDGKDDRSLDSRGIVLWSLSDDEGKTWREAEDWWALPARTHTGFQEPGVVELADGRIFSWLRNDQGAQYGCWSTDGGKRWPLPEKTELMSPESPASIKRLPESADLLAVFNDHSGRFAFQKNKRTPLVAAISKDGGKTWPKRRLIESDPDGWYCYTAIHFVDEAMLLAYCAGDSKVGGLNRLRIRRMSRTAL
jgi:Neuraminidase (sialidase)